jgi:hypothetical protein
VDVGKVKKKLQQIRRWEEELASSTPARAAKLTTKIVKWKGQVLDE